jgi:isopenicillin-N N-acyltransferase-like protein
MSPPRYELKKIECSGKPQALGHAQGEEARESVQAFVEQRFSALRAYLLERGSDDSAAFLQAGRECLAEASKWDPIGCEEFLAIAAASHVDPVSLYAAGNMTDIRDVVLLPAAEPEGCTALLVPGKLSEGGALHCGQTWDLNPADIDYVLAVHRRPANQPETWSVTCSGCLSLMGMNAEGVAVGTTNIKTTGTQMGVGYLSLLHRALREPTAASAAEVVAQAPRAAAHTYWFADEGQAVELECDARSATRRHLADVALARTNHCDSLADRQGEPANASSLARRARVERMLGTGRQNVDSLKALFQSREDGLDSINRYSEDGTGTSTNACMVCVPNRREIWACRGPADRGVWHALNFDS